MNKQDHIKLISSVDIYTASDSQGLRGKKIIELIKRDGVSCKHCQGIATEVRFYFDSKQLTLYKNIYGIDNNGREILFTIDHVIPKSKGGNNKLKNYQLLCQRCNSKKGNKLEQNIKKEN